MQPEHKLFKTMEKDQEIQKNFEKIKIPTDTVSQSRILKPNIKNRHFDTLELYVPKPPHNSLSTLLPAWRIFQVFTACACAVCQCREQCGSAICAPIQPC